jgi:hypothetical protein
LAAAAVANRVAQAFHAQGARIVMTFGERKREDAMENVAGAEHLAGDDRNGGEALKRGGFVEPDDALRPKSPPTNGACFAARRSPSSGSSARISPARPGFEKTAC